MEIWFINNYSDLFKTCVNRFKNLNIMRHTACLVFSPIMVHSYAVLLCLLHGGGLGSEPMKLQVVV